MTENQSAWISKKFIPRYSCCCCCCLYIPASDRQNLERNLHLIKTPGSSWASLASSNHHFWMASRRYKLFVFFFFFFFFFLADLGCLLACRWESGWVSVSFTSWQMREREREREWGDYCWRQIALRYKFCVKDICYRWKNKTLDNRIEDSDF